MRVLCWSVSIAVVAAITGSGTEFDEASFIFVIEADDET
jgi:hypothetical protein